MSFRVRDGERYRAALVFGIVESVEKARQLQVTYCKANYEDPVRYFLYPWSGNVEELTDGTLAERFGVQPF